jgi:hypothetical protein
MLKKAIKSFFISLSYGLKNAENDILKQKSTASLASNSVVQKVQMNQLAEGLLKGEVTADVEILRDRIYYVSDESKKYKVIIDTVGTSKAFKNLTKPNKPSVFEDDEYDVSIIMDNEAIPSGVISALNSVGGYGIKDIYPLKFEYEFSPKFKLEEYVKKLVFKTNKLDDRLRIELYVPTYVDSFERLEKLFDNEINKVKDGKRKAVNFDFNTVEFLSDKAYGIDDLRIFKFKMLKFIKIKEYDGKNILIYDVVQTESTDKITDKYINKKLREDYNDNSPRSKILNLSSQTSDKHLCDKCGGNVESEYDYRITKSTIGVGLCNKCLKEYNKKIENNS